MPTGGLQWELGTLHFQLPPLQGKGQGFGHWPVGIKVTSLLGSVKSLELQAAHSLLSQSLSLGRRFSVPGQRDLGAAAAWAPGVGKALSRPCSSLTF